MVAVTPCSAQISPWVVNAIYGEPSWGESFRSINGLAIDPVSGELYVADAGRHTVDVLDSTGAPRFSFVHWITDPKTEERQPGEPNALAISPAGEIFITDIYSHDVDVLDIRGERIGTIDVLKSIGWDRSECRPEKLGMDAAGRLYASITGERQGIVRCRPDGSDCQIVIDATKDSAAVITGMGVAPDGRVAVVDHRGLPAIRIYDPDGHLMIGFGAHEVDESDVSDPVGFLFAGDGTFWVVDALRHVVKHYSSDGKYLEYIGGLGSAPGQLRYPSAIAGDGVAHVYVAERVGRRVQDYLLPSALTVAVKLDLKR
ncbi:MAG: NHL repeat-containing protein [candidate division Zixibacteria bacterium]|nr:NHL repeat-containing protein [candidate division Zixibacteria bacterium]